MCHSSTLWLCPTSCSSYHHFIGEDKENQSAVQLDAIFASIMPPLPAQWLETLNPGCWWWNSWVTLPVLCLLVIILVVATRKWKTTKRNRAFVSQPCWKQDKKHDPKLQPQAKSDDPICSDVPAGQPLSWFPPPPGSTRTTASRAGQTLLLHSNSGTLAARAMAKLWPDPSLTEEAAGRHPWRRHSDPSSHAGHNDSSNVFITRDVEHCFDDADLNGFWRRRTLEFA